MNKHSLFAYERRPVGAKPGGLGLRAYEIAWQAPRASVRGWRRILIDLAVLSSFFGVGLCVVACIHG
jgi:hypothetical protein